MIRKVNSQCNTNETNRLRTEKWTLVWTEKSQNEGNKCSAVCTQKKSSTKLCLSSHDCHRKIERTKRNPRGKNPKENEEKNQRNASTKLVLWFNSRTKGSKSSVWTLCTCRKSMIRDITAMPQQTRSNGNNGLNMKKKPMDNSPYRGLATNWSLSNYKWMYLPFN